MGSGYFRIIKPAAIGKTESFARDVLAALCEPGDPRALRMTAQVGYTALAAGQFDAFRVDVARAVCNAFSGKVEHGEG